MNAEGNVRMTCQEVHGMQRPGTRYHQGRGTEQSIGKGTEDRRVDRVAHPKIICVDDQEAGICWMSQQPVCQAFVG